MGYNIGPTLAVGGEKEYNAAMKRVRESMHYVQSAAAAATSAYAKNDKSVESLTTRTDNLKKALQVQREAVAAAEDALKRMTDEGVDPSSTAYKRMEANLNNAKAALNQTETEIKSNTDAIKKLNDEARAEKLSKYTDALKNIGSIAGGAVAIGVKAGAAAMTAIGTATVAVTKILWDAGKAAGNWADELMTLSQQTGVSTQTLQGWNYAARFVDVNTDSMAKGLNRTVMAMGSATKVGKDYIQIANGQKVSLIGVNGQMRDSETVMYDVVDAIGSIANETDRQIAAQKIFGKSWQEMMPLINSGTDALRKYTDEARSLGLILSDEMVKQLGTFDDTMEKTEAQLDGLSRQAAVIFLPMLQGVATGISGILSEISTSLADGFQASDIETIGAMLAEKLTTGIQKVSEYLPAVIGVVSGAITEIVNVVVEMLPGLLPVLADGAFKLLNGLISTITSNASAIANMAIKLVMQLVGFLVEALPELIEAGVQIVAALMMGIAEALPELIPTIVQGIMDMVAALVDNLDLLLDAGLQLVMGLVQGIINAIPVLIEALPQIINSIITFVLGAIPQIIQAGIQLLTALVGALPQIITAIVEVIPQIIDGIITAVLNALPLIIQAGIDLLIALVGALPTIITTIVKAIPKIISGIVDALIGNIDKIIEAGIQLLIALVENLPAIIAGIVKAIPQIMKAIFEAFGSFFSKMAEVGLNLIKGLWQGISDAAAWIWDKIKGFFKGIVDGIKNFFGIHSPADKYFPDLGENMAKGIGVGFVDAMASVAADMQKALPITMGVDANVNYGIGAGRGSVVINQTNHFGSGYAARDGAAAVRDLNRRLGELYA